VAVGVVAAGAVGGVIYAVSKKDKKSTPASSP
jgi:hypothetical protein